MALPFKRPDVAAQYECLVDADRDVHKLKVYSGALSNINLPMAAYLAANPKLGLVKAKAAAKVAPPVQADAPVDKKKKETDQG